MPVHFFWLVTEAGFFGCSIVNLKPLILVKAINLMAEINNFLRISILYMKSHFIGKAWTGVIGEDQVAAAKTALQGSMEDFDQGVRREADFITWEREDARRTKKLLDLLTKLPNYKQIQPGCRQRRTIGTGEWLFRQPKFNQWLAGNLPNLWSLVFVSYAEQKSSRDTKLLTGAGKIFLL